MLRLPVAGGTGLRGERGLTRYSSAAPRLEPSSRFRLFRTTPFLRAKEVPEEDEKFQLHLDPEKQKTEMQRFAEDILRRICQGDPRGLEGRIQTLSEAIKAKKKWKGSTQTDFPYLPKGRERPFNSIVAAFTVDLYLLEGAEMNRIGIARTLRKADDVLAGMGMSDLLVPGKETQKQTQGYLPETTGTSGGYCLLLGLGGRGTEPGRTS